MDYLIRFVQEHDSFREPEIEALGTLSDVKIETIFYSPTSSFCIVCFHTPLINDEIARGFISRSILSRGIYELWGQGSTYEELHDDVRQRSRHLWARYETASFKFSIDAFLGKRSMSQQREIIDTFRFLPFEGRIDLINPDVEFAIFEEWELPYHHPHRNGITNGEKADLSIHRKPAKLFLGRKIGTTTRHLIEKHDLKQRPYISTTSMDAELALVTANLALAAPGKIFFDPFVGTGGFMVAAAELGAMTLGSDIDGRSFRGKGTGVEKGVGANFQKYGLNDLFGDCIISDLVHTPIRYLTPKPEDIVPVDGHLKNLSLERWLDGIICDPPYGVREGLKVLGTRNRLNPEAAVPVHMVEGVPGHTLEGYVAPKKPYSFIKMLDDILDFAARTLVDGGRLAFWMPTANDEKDIEVPQHHALELLHCCVQPFNKWSRRLLVYQRKSMYDWKNVSENDTKKAANGRSADELNPFRRKYFQGFETP